MHRIVKSIALVAVAAAAVIAVTASASVRVRPVPGSAPSLATAVTTPSSQLVSDIAAARLATAKYATNLARAKADGYQILTRMIPDMGYHYINPAVKGFDVRKPPILVYEHNHGRWQLGALEWVFTSMPARPPLPGAQYGVFGAACHYKDGTVVFADSSAKCAPRAPRTGAPLNFWHPRLITLHFWVWYPNTAGVYMGTNPLVTLFNRG